MPSKNYSLRIEDRAEVAVYSDDDVRLLLCGSFYRHRLEIVCNTTTGFEEGLRLPFLKRKEIVENLCDYFETRTNPATFALEEKDQHRTDFEQLFSTLVRDGHRITIEYESDEKRERHQDETNISFLQSGWKIPIEGGELRTVKEYRQWRLTNRLPTTRPNLRLHSVHFSFAPRREWALPTGGTLTWKPVRVSGMTAAEVRAARKLLKKAGCGLYPEDVQDEGRLADGTLVQAGVWEDWLVDEGVPRTPLGIKLPNRGITSMLAGLLYDLASTARLLLESPSDREAVACPWAPGVEVLARWPRARAIHMGEELLRFLT